MSAPTREAWAVRNEDGLWYLNKNSGSTKWVPFERAQIFNKRGQATSAANRTNNAWEFKETAKIPAVPVKLIITVVEPA
ncbi:MAG: hypothetical protein HRU00_17240 [Myxococcales bacterium]|nr:hypothetical protein [Myxococcales bacterium]